MENIKCKKCGTTENVNFDGMCKKCYDESIIIKENNDNIEKDDLNKTNSKFNKEKVKTIAIIILSILFFASAGSNDKQENVKLKQQIEAFPKQTQELRQQVDEFNIKLKDNEEQIKKLQEKNESLENEKKTLETDKQNLENETVRLNNEIEQLKLSKSNNSYIKTTSTSNIDNTSSTPSSSTYILNTNSKKFHKSTCASAKKIKDSNRETFDGSRDSLINQGYTPCKNCNP